MRHGGDERAAELRKLLRKLDDSKAIDGVSRNIDEHRELIKTLVDTALDPDHSPEYEQHYIAGTRSALVGMLAYVLRDLGYKGTEAEHTKWILEREQTVAALRRICADHGDNDWSDDLHLEDVIEKHLAPYLETEDE